MATGEIRSVRSQRELFEYQIGLEREELATYPEARAPGAGAHLRGQGAAAGRSLAAGDAQIVSDPEQALDTLAREELESRPR